MKRAILFLASLLVAGAALSMMFSCDSEEMTETVVNQDEVFNVKAISSKVAEMKALGKKHQAVLQRIYMVLH